MAVGGWRLADGASAGQRTSESRVREAANKRGGGAAYGRYRPAPFSSFAALPNGCPTVDKVWNRRGEAGRVLAAQQRLISTQGESREAGRKRQRGTRP